MILFVGFIVFWFVVLSGQFVVILFGDLMYFCVVFVFGVIGFKEDFVLVFFFFVEVGYFVQFFDFVGQYEFVVVGVNVVYMYELFIVDFIVFLEVGVLVYLFGYFFVGIVVQFVVVCCFDFVLLFVFLIIFFGFGNVFVSMKWLGWFVLIVSFCCGVVFMIWGIVMNKNRVLLCWFVFVCLWFVFISCCSVDEIVGLMMVLFDLCNGVWVFLVFKFVVVGLYDLWFFVVYECYVCEIYVDFWLYVIGYSLSEIMFYQLVVDFLDFYVCVC